MQKNWVSSPGIIRNSNNLRVTPLSGNPRPFPVHLHYREGLLYAEFPLPDSAGQYQTLPGVWLFDRSAVGAAVVGDLVHLQLKGGVGGHLEGHSPFYLLPL